MLIGISHGVGSRGQESQCVCVPFRGTCFRFSNSFGNFAINFSLCCLNRLPTGLHSPISLKPGHSMNIGLIHGTALTAITPINGSRFLLHDPHGIFGYGILASERSLQDASTERVNKFETPVVGSLVSN